VTKIREKSFTGNGQILKSKVLDDFQDSKVLKSFLGRHNHRKFSDGSENYSLQVIAGLESAFDTTLFPTNSSHLYCHKGARWGRQDGVFHRARETLDTPLSKS